ncbi:MAG: M36 family metallopeptidase [Polyangia bacterium]
MSLLPLGLIACSSPPAAPPQAAAPALPLVSDAYVAHRDPQLGVPTLVWVQTQAQPAAGADARGIAWRVLNELAPTYGLSTEALQAARLRDVHDVGRGAVIAQFEQEVDGIEVFRLSLNVALTHELVPVGASGYLANQLRRTDFAFALTAADAVARALSVMTGAAVQPERSEPGQSGYLAHTISPFTAAGTRYRAATAPRSKKVWFPTAGGLLPAYYVELDLSLNDQPDSQLRSYVVAASDGSILFENDLTANDAYTYRVFADKDGTYAPWDGPHGNAFTPHPTGRRDGTALTYVASQLVKLESAPFSKKDPWLPAMATEARGNNAVAYADTVAPDGYNMGDVMLKPSMPGEFDYNIDASKDDPAANSTTIQAVTANFFYIVNYLHDTFYDAGWNEASRNPQKDNFGRGGVANDPIRAESQDNSGRNNANASTPADGTSPRIQMYLFDPKEDAVRINSPMDLARVYQTGRASFGPSKFDVKEDLVLVDDGGGMSATDGCETPFKNAAAIKDKIAVIDRGDCYFEIKAYNAMANGAKGVVIVNNVADPPGGMATAPTPPPMPVTIPAVMFAQADGNAVKAKLAAGTAVNLSLRAIMTNNDSSLDGMIVSHEWGHVLSNRLIGNANGLSNNQGRSMGEGWSDFVALLMTTRPEDAMAMSNADWTGAFAAAAYSTGPGNNSAYEGIRRYPYSSDLAKNPLMFRHITNGVALPMMPAPSFGQDGISNAEVHNSGEVWANTLWECYVALLRDTARYNFAQATQAMREYLVASLKLTPVSPTMLEARDAVLMAAMARDAKDFELFARAFAKRGMGVGAVAPVRGSANHSGAVESTAVGGAIVIESVTLSDTGRSCDNDGILDDGELGVLTVKVRNTGTLPFSARATLTTESAGLVFISGRSITFPPVQPYGSATGKLVVSLSSRTPQTLIDLKVSADAPGLAIPGAVTTQRRFLGNYDLAANSDSGDSMDDPAGWTPAGDAMLDASQPWGHVREGAEGRWSITDNAAPSDQSLVSPPLVISATGSFGMSLRHRYSFEADSLTSYDGGVIEISTDNGMTWTDTGKQLTTRGYNGTVWTQNAPLKSRQAFVGKSAGYPAYTTTEADFGTAYQGKTVRLRFRVGTDPSEGGPGWDLDEVRFTGVTNQPFSSRRPNACRLR